MKLKYQLFESHLVADNMPLEDIQTCSKECFSLRNRILRLITGNAKTNYSLKNIVINMIANNTRKVTEVSNIKIVGSYTIFPTLQIIENNSSLSIFTSTHFHNSFPSIGLCVSVFV